MVRFIFKLISWLNINIFKVNLFYKLFINECLFSSSLLLFDDFTKFSRLKGILTVSFPSVWILMENEVLSFTVKSVHFYFNFCYWIVKRKPFDKLVSSNFRLSAGWNDEEQSSKKINKFYRFIYTMIFYQLLIPLLWASSPHFIGT